MTLPLGPALVLALGLGVAVAFGTPIVLRRLPEPDKADEADVSGTDDPADDKIPYASLATGAFAVTAGTLAAAASAIPAVLLPVGVLPVWLVLATVGVLLAAIDARTTWLPLPLTQVAWIAMATAIAVGVPLGGGAQAVRSVAGFVLAGAVFYGAWLLTRGGFGFGDVRYAPLVGAATAAVSWQLLAWALVLGSLVGAAVGLARLAGGRRGAFAYAPSILAGGYLAVVATWLTT